MFNRIPLAKPYFDEQEEQGLARCLASRYVSQGQAVAEFEKKIVTLQGTGYALAVTSCTTALHLAVRALGLGLDDEIVVPSFTWVATAHAVEYSGAKVVFADIDSCTFNMTAQSLEAAISPRTKAVIVVHLFGQPAPMNEIMELARKYNLYVIEDAACALGAKIHGNYAGSIGDIGCFSFHPRKIITTGEGGMLVTNKAELAQKLAALRNHGATLTNSGANPGAFGHPKGTTLAKFDTLGLNFRMCDIQGSMGCAQMDKLQMLLESRATQAGIYNQILANHSDVITPSVMPDSSHVWQAYVVRILGNKNRRDSIMAHMEQQGIESRAGTQAVHRLPYYVEKYGLTDDHCPNATLCEDTSLTLPLFYELTYNEQERVCTVLAEALQKKL